MYRLLFVLSVILSFSIGHMTWASEPESQRSVLVTGASSGIGLAVTKHLAGRGFHVYAGARKAEDLVRLDAIHNVSAVRLDVTRQAEIDAAQKYIEEQGRGLFGVVNNAGVASIGSLTSVSDEDVQWIHDVNVMGPLRINRAFMPMLQDAKGRTIIVGSGSGFVTSANGGAYSMSKFAVEAYTDTLSDELADKGVVVGIVEPGAYRSRGREKIAMQMLTGSPDLQQQLTDEQAAVFESVRMANEELKEPHEVAEAIHHFLTSNSPRARYLVVPDKQTANIVIRTSLRRVVQLNTGQEYELSRDELTALLEELLADDGLLQD